jgi:hypothetical protein
MASTFTWLLVPLGLLLAAPNAGSVCACRCVEGTARTVCTTLDEAAANPQLCASTTPHAECPIAPAGFEPQQFPPPVPGALDCREARLWEPATGGYTTTTRVCDTVRATDGLP